MPRATWRMMHNFLLSISLFPVRVRVYFACVFQRPLPLGDIRWTVVTSDISNAEENRENLIFCDFLPAKWYQLRISATNDAGKTTEHYHFSTTNIDGITIPPPSVFPSENDLTNNLINSTNPTSGDWFATLIVVVIITVSIITM